MTPHARFANLLVTTYRSHRGGGMWAASSAPRAGSADWSRRCSRVTRSPRGWTTASKWSRRNSWSVRYHSCLTSNLLFRLRSRSCSSEAEHTFRWPQASWPNVRFPLQCQSEEQRDPTQGVKDTWDAVQTERHAHTCEATTRTTATILDRERFSNIVNSSVRTPNGSTSASCDDRGRCQLYPPALRPTAS